MEQGAWTRLVEHTSGQCHCKNCTEGGPNAYPFDWTYDPDRNVFSVTNRSKPWLPYYVTLPSNLALCSAAGTTHAREQETAMEQRALFDLPEARDAETIPTVETTQPDPRWTGFSL